MWMLWRSGWIRRPPSVASLSEPLGYSLPMIFAALAYVGYQSADRLYVAIYDGIAAAGRYEAAYRVALLVSTVNVVTLHSFNPLFYAAYAKGDRAGASKLLRKTSLQVAGVVVFWLPCSRWSRSTRSLLAESYQTSRSIVVSIPILAAGIWMPGHLAALAIAASGARPRQDCIGDFGDRRPRQPRSGRSSHPSHG